MRAGAGTDHLGVGNCAKHGGNTISHRKAAQMEIATNTAKLLAAPVATNPFDSIRMLEAEARGYVEYFRRQVQALDPDMVYVRPTSVLRRPLDEGSEGESPGNEVEEITEMPADLNIAIKAHQKAMEDLRRISKTAIDSNLAERLVSLQENRSQFIVGAIQGIFRELGIPLDAKSMPVIRKHLEIVESTAEEANSDEE